MTEDPYSGVASLLKLATDWLTGSEGANVALELAAHDLRWRGDWRLSIYRTPQEIQGVSIVMPGRRWLMDARDKTSAYVLANAAVIHGKRPATLITSERVSAVIKPFLKEQNAIAQESKLQILRSTKTGAAAEGRWATTRDLPKLEAYQKKISREQRSRMDTAWKDLIARKELAILADKDAVLASIRRYGPAPSVAGVADLFVASKSGQSEIASRLLGFVVAELLAGRKAVYVFVDDRDRVTLDLYRGAGFEQVGTCYHASLK